MFFRQLFSFKVADELDKMTFENDEIDNAGRLKFTAEFTAEYIRKFRRAFKLLNHAEGFIDETNLEIFAETEKELYEFFEVFRIHVPRSTPREYLEHPNLLPFQKGLLMTLCSMKMFSNEFYISDMYDTIGEGLEKPKLATTKASADSIEKINSFGKAFATNGKPGEF